MYFYISVCSTHTSNMFKAFSPLVAGQLVENLYVKSEVEKEEVEEKQTLPDDESRAVPDKLAHVLPRVQQGCCLSLFY